MTQDFKTPDLTPARKLVMTIDALLYNQQILEQILDARPFLAATDAGLIKNAIGQIKAARTMLKKIETGEDSGPNAQA